MSVRLRQAVIAAAELEPVAGRLREELGPYFQDLAEEAAT